MNKRRRERIDRDNRDREWSKQVRERDGSCIICHVRERLQAHHLIPRFFIETRWDLTNGVTLCPTHHKFGRYSAHKNGIWFSNWLMRNRPEVYNYVSERLKE